MDLHNRSYREKFNLAENTNTPEDVLRELAKDENMYVRWSVAKNPSTPDDILRNLTKDKEAWVNKSVAYNPGASSKILLMQFEYEKSFKEPREDIIKALYYHKNLPYIAKRVIETLFGDIL